MWIWIWIQILGYLVVFKYRHRAQTSHEGICYPHSNVLVEILNQTVTVEGGSRPVGCWVGDRSGGGQAWVMNQWLLRVQDLSLGGTVKRCVHCLEVWMPVGPGSCPSGHPGMPLLATASLPSGYHWPSSRKPSALCHVLTYLPVVAVRIATAPSGYDLVHVNRVSPLTEIAGSQVSVYQKLSWQM